ncbi:MAG: response regulator transcription factor [Clostridia bacterium]|nr:response regulator transcription factor [Clostridia bacterium]
MYKILIADDEEKIRLLIKKYGEYEGHIVHEAENGIQAVAMCRNGGYDVVIMDIMMPELNGLSATREIRKFSDVPIIMLSARGEEYDRISGFEFGADDYVVKPFSPKELMLRVDAVMKRFSSKDSLRIRDIFNAEGLSVDFDARTVTIDGVRTDLSPKEYDLLFYMIRNKNIALHREQILSAVWGYDFYGDDRTLDTHVKLLRKSLGPYAKYIVTVRGVGYRFET